MGYYGFLPKTRVSSTQNQIVKPGDNLCYYYDQQSAVLSLFCKADDRLQNIKLPIGSVELITVNITPYMLFVIQEMQEKDTLCGCFGPLTLQFKATVSPVIFRGTFIWIF